MANVDRACTLCLSSVVKNIGHHRLQTPLCGNEGGLRDFSSASLLMWLWDQYLGWPYIDAG